MRNSVKNFILMMLIGSSILIAGFTSDADGKSFEKDYCEYSAGSSMNYFADNQRDSEFWNKFRDSVMPDDKRPSSDFTGNDNPDPKPKKSDRKAN